MKTNTMITNIVSMIQICSKKLNKYANVIYKKSIEEALISLNQDKDNLIVITGSLYLAGELLNLN